MNSDEYEDVEEDILEEKEEEETGMVVEVMEKRETRKRGRGREVERHEGKKMKAE